MVAVAGLACPACRSDLQPNGELSLICDTCGARYPVFDGIPSFVAPSAHPDPPPRAGEGKAIRGGGKDLTVLVSSPHPAVPAERLLTALRQELGSLAIDYELIVMDTGETYGRALRSGLEQATGESVLTL